jgi:HSP20 family molecular chaperone IbpA
VDIVSEKVDASLKDGILTIRIPKADALLTKKVKVRGF